jgi:hypothetical protein
MESITPMEHLVSLASVPPERENRLFGQGGQAPQSQLVVEEFSTPQAVRELLRTQRGVELHPSPSTNLSQRWQLCTHLLQEKSLRRMAPQQARDFACLIPHPLWKVEQVTLRFNQVEQ